MLLIGFWIFLLPFTVYCGNRHYNGIPLLQFCDCWNFNINRTGTNVLVDISFDKLCWESPSNNPGGFKVTLYDTSLVFGIGIYKSHFKLIDYKTFTCQLNKGCFTTVSMVGDTSLEIFPACESCKMCKGKPVSFSYITHKKNISHTTSYTTHKKKIGHTTEVVTIKPMSPPVQESYHSRFPVMAGVVTIVATIATVIIIMLVCQIIKTRIQQREYGHQLLDGGNDTTDEETDVSVPIEPCSPHLPPNQPMQPRQPVKIGVFHPHMPKELSSQKTENTLDEHVQHMISILTSAQELNVNYLTANLTNLFDGIDAVSCSPKIILVLCDRFCELCHEGNAQMENAAQEQWTDTERKLLKRIHEKYYENNTCLYFVNFKQFKQCENVLAEVRAMFTKHSYKVFSIGSLDQNDIHFKLLLDSVLSDVISESETRSKRIMSLLSPDMQPMSFGNELEERFMSLCE